VGKGEIAMLGVGSNVRGGFDPALGERGLRVYKKINKGGVSNGRGLTVRWNGDCAGV